MAVRQLDPIAARHSDETSAADAASGRQTEPARRRTWLVAAAMLAVVGGVYLVQQHWTHLAGNWVYLVLLACPLMHLFMHGGHGGHGSHHAHGGDPDGGRGAARIPNPRHPL